METTLLALSFPGLNLLGTVTARKSSPGFRGFPRTEPEGWDSHPRRTATPRANHGQQVAHQAVQLQGCGRDAGLGQCLGDSGTSLVSVCPSTPRASSPFSALVSKKCMNSKLQTSLVQCHFNIKFNNKFLMNCHNAYNFSSSENHLMGQPSSNSLKSVTKTPVIHRCIFPSISMCPNIQSKFCLPPQLGHFALCTSNP